MVGLGDLAGGIFNSRAQGISADGSVVVGYSNSFFGDQAFRWTSGGGMVGLGDLAGGIFLSNAFGVSADGSVVVGVSNSASGTEAFRWTSGGGMVGLGDLAGGTFNSRAQGVSADGSVVVGFGTSASGSVAFIWDAVNGMRSLQDVLVNDYGLDLTGWLLGSAVGISADGTSIVGYGTHNGQTEAWLAVLPEPGTGVLVGTGLLGLVGRRSRRA
jgi:probable HAF family extracellular repeat protein